MIGDLVHLPPGAKGLYARLKEKAGIDYRIPGSLRVRVAEETIRDWLKAYRRLRLYPDDDRLVGDWELRDLGNGEVSLRTDILAPPEK